MVRKRLSAIFHQLSNRVAELSADPALPVGVARMLLGGLFETGRVRGSRPVPAAELSDEWILHEVINGLRTL
ncbi:DUF742 domain-containing protein [Streptomyces sp. NBC_01433]|uniref:DUF742 domain-containing protein n=1 Tax=Streptomyces sp. NBC_01433 TaxID=2903864 RepID=UPI00225A4C63|nr:DUF742 domain-containing protein [Streptomyces sp. NBC_01433]MCX4679406.1 DUF742 domain-containing protein [Streptomyces sp. NBC_01433]